MNVSAMEGKFYRHKDVTHPHTNMAKAALNMMTRTSGADFVKDNIYMCGHLQHQFGPFIAHS